MPDPTIWSISPHTAAKHRILRHYLGAWFPILRGHSQEIVVDGFAGPGVYAGGEPGSPIVALSTALNHIRDLSLSRLDFIFIEERSDRYTRLIEEVASLGDLPPNFHVQIRPGKFADEIEGALAEAHAQPNTPMFIMLDPMGPSGMPMRIVSELARRRYVDLLVSFMYGSMGRWLEQPNYHGPMTELFGDEGWRPATELQGERRRAYLHDGYRDRLKGKGFTKVGSFEMLDRGNSTEYYLMFGAHDIKALEAIKAAMWKVDPNGGQQFADREHESLALQPLLIQPEPDGDALRRELRDHFRGTSATIEAVEEFVLESTNFRQTHVRKYALQPLEKAGLIMVETSGQRRAGTYPPGSRITFKP